MSAMAPPASTPEVATWKQGALVRARDQLARAEYAARRATVAFSSTAGRHFMNDASDDELKEAEGAYDAALRTVRRAQAILQHFTGEDHLPRFGRL